MGVLQDVGENLLCITSAKIRTPLITVSFEVVRVTSTWPPEGVPVLMEREVSSCVWAGITPISDPPADAPIPPLEVPEPPEK